MSNSSSTRIAATNGRVWVDDEDEFVAACLAGAISDDEQVAARAAATEMERRLRVLDEPFGTAGWGWLREGMTMSLPRLTELS
jgi:exosome complex RNA-binding protein Rrp4